MNLFGNHAGARVLGLVMEISDDEWKVFSPTHSPGPIVIILSRRLDDSTPANHLTLMRHASNHALRLRLNQWHV